MCVMSSDECYRTMQSGYLFPAPTRNVALEPLMRWHIHVWDSCYIHLVTLDSDMRMQSGLVLPNYVSSKTSEIRTIVTANRIRTTTRARIAHRDNIRELEVVIFVDHFLAAQPF